MPKIFWIDTPIEYTYPDRYRLHSPETKATLSPGWYYTQEDDEDHYWSTPFEDMKTKAPHFDISIGDKVLTRNGSIMNVGGSNSERKDKPQEVQFWFFKDEARNRDSDHEGTLAYYDKYLNHSSGNHIDKLSGYDIIGPYDDKDDVCPCCKRRYDGRKA